MWRTNRHGIGGCLWSEPENKNPTVCRRIQFAGNMYRRSRHVVYNAANISFFYGIEQAFCRDSDILG